VSATRHDPVLARLAVSQRDLPTLDKLPVIRELLSEGEGDPPLVGPALDVGIGTGFITRSAFGGRFTVCIDLDQRNLRAYRELCADAGAIPEPGCVVASAEALPFKPGVFAAVLCSEVLEHIPADQAAATELGRVVAPGGRLVVTVPYTGLGTVGFLGRLGVRTVHDFPGPERHVRPGYDEASLAALFAPAGMISEQVGWFSRFFTRLATDAVSLAHIVYQRAVHGRRSWTWADVGEARGGLVFRLYELLFPALRAFSRLDRLLARRRGFGIAARLRKPAVRASRTGDRYSRATGD
jgi:SAM-dependent methyltransferase